MLVIKIGGADGVDTNDITADTAAQAQAGTQLVIVHGGSGLATELGKQLGYPPRFVTSVSGHTSRYVCTNQQNQQGCKQNFRKFAIYNHGFSEKKTLKK